MTKYLREMNSKKENWPWLTVSEIAGCALSSITLGYGEPGHHDCSIWQSHCFQHGQEAQVRD